MVFPRDTPKDAAIADAFNDATRISGIVLALACLTELIMANIIADFSAKTEAERNRLYTKISEKASFDVKTERLMRVLSEKSLHHTMQSYPDLKDRLDKLRKLRNRMAHSFPDTTDEYLAEKYHHRVRFVWYKHGRREYEDITWTDAQKRIHEAGELVLDVDTIRHEVGRFPPV